MKRVSEKWKAHRGVLHLSIMKLKLFKGTALECTNVSSVGRERGWTTLKNAVTCWWKRAMFFDISTPPPPQITKSIAFRENIKHNNNVKPLDYIHEGEFFLHLSWMESPCMNHYHTLPPLYRFAAVSVTIPFQKMCCGMCSLAQKTATREGNWLSQSLFKICIFCLYFLA